MSRAPRVDLLPREYEERERARRARSIAALAILGVVVILVALYGFQLWRVNQAENELAAEEQELAELQAELDRLREFEELRARLDQATEIVTVAMSGEASAAGILQDVAAVMPGDAALLSLNADLVPQQDAETGQATSFGFLSGEGETLGRHAPGVERFVLQLDKIAAFFNIHVASSVLDEEGFTTFTFEADLGPEILTGRYQDGIPERLR